MYYATKGQRYQPRLITNAEPGKRHSMYYDQFERSFLRRLDQLDWTTVLDIAESAELKEAEQQIAGHAADVDQLRQKLDKLEALLVDMPSPTLKARYMETEMQLQAAQGR
jgi:hypothetical protein